MNDKIFTGRGNGTGSTFGLILIGFGALLLLSNLGIIDGLGGIVGLLILGGIGAWLLNQYHIGRRHLWLLFAGYTMLGAAAATVTGPYAGAWFLGITGLGFVSAWRENDTRWWAIIPAGTLLTLAGVVVADQTARWLDGGVVFFAGMAATFLTVYSLPRHGKSWALFPAAASAALALLIWGSTGSWLLPIILIGAGLYLMRGESLNLGNGNTWNGGAARRQPNGNQPGPSAAEEAPATGTEETKAAPREEVTPRQLPDRLSGAGPDLPEGWAERRPDSN